MKQSKGKEKLESLWATAVTVRDAEEQKKTLWMSCGMVPFFES